MLSCAKKPIESPWTLDPVYSDLVAQQAGATAKVEAQKKKIEDLSGELSKLQGRNPQLKRTALQKANLERGLLQLEQEAKYFEIRAEQRRLADKEAYAKAFKADLPWPDPAEYAEYQELKKLRTSSRNWEDKVPKATQYSKPNPEMAKKKDAKPAAEGEAAAPAAGAHE